MALLIEPDGQITYRDLGKPIALHQTLRAYHATLSSKQGVKTYATASALQAQLGLFLLAPLKDKLRNKRHWIISADGPLGRLPFETLVMDNTPILQTHDISYASALSTHAALRQRAAAYATTPRSKTLLVMSAMGNERSREENGEMASDAVGKLFTDQEASLYLDDQSTPAHLHRLNTLGKLQHYRYLLFDAADQRFAAGGSSHADWLACQLRSDLIILPPVTQADSLPFDLALAGNINVIMPLWRTDEAIKAEFLRRFFVRLKAGEDQVTALNAVKREFLTSPLLNEPVFWAPFVLHGV
jgi:CHAT domain-containing protein